MNGSRSFRRSKKPPQLNNLGPATGKNRSMREWIDNEMSKTIPMKSRRKQFATACQS